MTPVSASSPPRPRHPKSRLRPLRGAGFPMKLYPRLKFRMCPILRIEAYVPDGCDILDLGCGNGLFTAILKLGSPDRKIIGIDLDARKITAARRFLGKLRGVISGSATSFPPLPQNRRCTIIDVLYLLPVETQNAILKKCPGPCPPGER